MKKKPGLLLLVASALTISGTSFALQNETSKVEADTLTHLGEVSLTEAMVSNPFGNGNAFLLLAMEGSDFPTNPTSEPEKYKSAISSIITFDIPGTTKFFDVDDNKIPVTDYLSVYGNQYLRPSCFSMWFSGSALAKSILLEKNFKIPSYALITGNTSSPTYGYYTLDDKYALHAVDKNYGLEQGTFEWTISKLDPSDVSIRKVQTYVDSGHEMLTFFLSGLALDYPQVNGQGDYAFPSGTNYDTLLPNFKDKIKLFDENEQELAYSFEFIASIDAWTVYPTFTIGIDVLSQAKHITIASGVKFPSYARYQNNTASEVYGGFVANNELNLEITEAEHVHAAIIDWVEVVPVYPLVRSLSLKKVQTQNPFNNYNEFLMLTFSEATDFAGVGSVCWSSSVYKLCDNLADHITLYGENNQIIEQFIFDIYFNYNGSSNNISFWFRDLALVKRIVLSEGLHIPSHALYKDNKDSPYYGHYYLSTTYDLTIPEPNSHSQGSLNDWEIPSCTIEYYDEKDNLISDYTEIAPCGSLHGLAPVSSKKGHDGSWEVVSPSGLTIENGKIQLPGTTSTIKVKAHYELRTYTLSFAGISDTIQVRYNERIGTLPAITQQVDRVGDWAIDGVVITSESLYEFDDNKTAEIIWRDRTLAVTLYADGEVFDVLNVVYSSSVGRLPTPEKEGFVFKYWMEDFNTKVPYDIEKEVLTNINLYAYFLPKCVVSFNTDGGSLIESVEVGQGETVDLSIVPTKEGYIFSKWTLDGKTFTESSVVEDDIILVAVWEKDPNHKDSPQKSGCGGDIASSSIILSALAVSLASVLILKLKKKED